ncbi:MAG TPA: NAD(P)H-binding protein [Kofleriaceae bacterium]|nr:NAD(P)H-binding protein [Kofleriaceae bacterium]
MRNVLVAGATGTVGRELTRLLHERGERVRTLSRDPARAESLRAIAHDVRTGDALREETLDGALQGIDAVVSCLGGPLHLGWGERRGYPDIDTVANRNLLAAARAAGVRRFVYLSVHAAPGYDATAYVRAHEAFAAELAGSGVSAGIVCATGIFPTFAPFLKMARRGLVCVPGSGRARTNPVHAIDVAEACAGMLDSDTTRLSIGGPDVMTRDQLVRLPFQVLDRVPRVAHVPRLAVLACAALMRPIHPRLAQLVDFAARVFTSDCVAPALGRRRIVDYFAELASETSAT